MERQFLLYPHTRSIFQGSQFKSIITKWFVSPKFEGSCCGNFDAILSVDNYEEVKAILPMSLKPLESSDSMESLLKKANL